MTSEFVESSQSEAEEIGRTLEQLNALLDNAQPGQAYTGEIEKLRGSAREMLRNMKGNLAALADLDARDPFKDNPALAPARYKLIRDIEGTKVDFSLDIVPALEKLTKRMVADGKQNPPAEVDESRLPPPPSGERWTVQRVLDTAGELVDQAGRAGTIAIKAYGLVKALGLVLGVPLP